jgi:hypothetical protein
MCLSDKGDLIKFHSIIVALKFATWYRYYKAHTLWLPPKYSHVWRKSWRPSSPGDGIIFEVYNGLMKRQDKVEAIKMPLAIIPGGSGKILIRWCVWYIVQFFTSHTLRSTVQPWFTSHIGGRQYYKSAWWIESNGKWRHGKSRLYCATISA